MQKAKQIFIKGLFLTLAFLMVGIGEVEKVNANDGSSIAITSPNGGELWESNSSHLITWTQTNVDLVQLRVCFGINNNCEILVNSLETSGNTGSYNWNIPSNLLKRADYKIYITGWQAGGISSDQSDEVFTIGDSATSMDYNIQLLSQTTDEIWEVGKSYVIKWSNSNPDYIKEIDIVLATIDKTNEKVWLPYRKKYHTFGVIESIKGQTNYSKTVIAPSMDESDYKIKLRGKKAYNGYLTETVSSGGFVNLSSSVSAIAPPTNIKVTGILNNRYNEAPQIAWTSPAGIKLSRIYRSTTKGEIGELLHSEDFISYASSNEASFVDQNYSAQYGIDYYYTIRSAGTLGRESENIDQCHYRKDKLTDVVFPNGGEILGIGKSYHIKWNSTGNTGKVNISLMENYNNMPRESKVLFSNIENSGSVLWTIDSTIEVGSNYKIRITNPDSLFYNYNDSDNNFSVVEFGTSSDNSTCLPDNTLIKLPGNPKIYVIRNCERHWIRTAEEFRRGGYRWEDVQESTFDIVNALPEVFISTPTIQEGALIRTIGDVDIYIVKYIGNKKFKRLILNPSVFNSYRHLRWEDIVEVESETTNSFTTSNLVRNATTGEIYRLTANGDIGTRRHFRSVGVMQRLGYDLDAVYEINEIDENSYQQGDDLE